MNTLRLHHERFQVQQASACSIWFVMGMPGSLASDLGNLPGAYAPCGSVSFVTKNPEGDR